MLQIPQTDQIFKYLDHVIGLDISFVKGTDRAVCTGVIVSYPGWQLVHSETIEVIITEPYIAGFLAFREIEHYLAVYKLLKDAHPDKCNELIITDGNGILHPNQFGLASHLGVLLKVPTIGCAKNLHHIDGLCKKTLRNEMDNTGTDILAITGNSGKEYGYAVRGKGNVNPVFLSIGHMVSLATVRTFAEEGFIVREPEATRLADRISREWIRSHP